MRLMVWNLAQTKTGYSALLPEFPTILPLFPGLQLTLQGKICQMWTSFLSHCIYKELGIEPCFSTTYHPQTQGQVENNNKWMETYLWMFCSHWQDDWAELLPMAEFTYNNHHHPSIDTTPFFMNYGYHPTLTNVPSAGQSDKPNKWIWQICDTQEECKCMIKQSQEISKQAYNKWKNKNPGFEVRDSVWLEATNLSTDEPSPKHASKWHGPFKIKDKLSDLTYHLKLPLHWRIHDVFHVNVLLEAKPNMIPWCRQPVPPPVKVNDKDFWVMEKYVDAQWFQNWFQFKIQWDGFSEEHNTWEDTDGIDSDDGPQVLGEDDDDFNLEEDFYHRHPDTLKRTDPPAAWRQPTRQQRACCWSMGTWTIGRGYCDDITIFLCFSPIFLYSTPLCSTTNPQSTDFSIFHQSPSHTVTQKTGSHLANFFL